MLSSDPRLKTIRVGGLSGLAFTLMFTYALSRPATESLFLEAHSTGGLPAAWLLVAAGALLVAAVYNRFVHRSGLLLLYGVGAMISALTLVLLLLGRGVDLPAVHYLLYAWKDIHVVVLIEIFFSYANAVFPIRTARWVYGLFGIMGSLGGIAGNLAVGVLARRLGTADTLWVVPPVLLLLGLACLPFSRVADTRAPHGDGEVLATLTDAVRVVRRSAYLLLAVMLIALVQIVVTLIDYRYNMVLEQTFPQTDQRTGIIGMVYAGIDLSTILLHALTGPVLRLLGVPVTLVAVPLVLGSGLCIFALLPRFSTMALVKAASKSLDYTLFRAAKEILYIPLTYAEKTMGKSLVDMVTYRMAKGGASLLLLILVMLLARNLVTPLTLALVVAWVIITLVVVRRFRRQVSREQEMAPD